MAVPFESVASFLHQLNNGSSSTLWAGLSQSSTLNITVTLTAKFAFCGDRNAEIVYQETTYKLHINENSNFKVKTECN